MVHSQLIFLERTKREYEKTYGTPWESIEYKIIEDIENTFDDEKFVKMDPEFLVDAAYCRREFGNKKPSLADYLLWTARFVADSEYVELWTMDHSIDDTWELKNRISVLENENRLLRERLNEAGISYADIVEGDSDDLPDYYDPNQGARMRFMISRPIQMFTGGILRKQSSMLWFQVHALILKKWTVSYMFWKVAKNSESKWLLWHGILIATNMAGMTSGWNWLSVFAKRVLILN